jgi:hypothetical protein
MASALDKTNAQRRLHEPPAVAAVVVASDLKAAKADERVQAFLSEADAYLAELERQGRIH